VRSTPFRTAPIVALLALAGCGALPPATGPETGADVRVEVNSDADSAHVIAVGVAPAGHRGLAVELANGTVREYPDARGIEEIPERVLPRAVALRPVGDAVETRTHRFSGVQGASATFEDVRRNATVYYSVAHQSGPEPLRTTGRLTCGPQATLTEVTLRINVEGSVAVGNDCALDSSQ
jgi:hypothetical protein